MSSICDNAFATYFPPSFAPRVLFRNFFCSLFRISFSALFRTFPSHFRPRFASSFASYFGPRFASIRTIRTITTMTTIRTLGHINQLWSFAGCQRSIFLRLDIKECFKNFIKMCIKNHTPAGWILGRVPWGNPSLDSVFI